MKSLTSEETITTQSKEFDFRIISLGKATELTKGVWGHWHEYGGKPEPR